MLRVPFDCFLWSSDTAHTFSVCVGAVMSFLPPRAVGCFTWFPPEAAFDFSIYSLLDATLIVFER